MVEMDFLRYAVLGFLVCWSTKVALILASVLLVWFVGEFVFWEIVTAWCDYQRQPAAPFANWIELDPLHWKVVAELQPSSNEIIEKVVHCNSDPIDDPLHLHVSLVYAVGIQWRNSFWRTITIWRVSTLTGQRKRVYSFAYIDPCLFSTTARFKVSAFYSRGVIFVHVRDVKEIGDGHHAHDHNSLLVYDIRHNKSAKFRLDPHPIGENVTPLAILCLGRRVKKQSVEGWRIRFVGLGTPRDDVPGDRMVFANLVADISASSSGSVGILSQDELLLRRAEWWRLIRSPSKVGIRRIPGPRTFVYDMETNRFELFDGLAAFINSDKMLKEYDKKRPLLIWSLPFWGKHAAVITDREIVLNVKNGTVFIRDSFQPPTLRMLAAQAVFKADPKLAKLKAAQFRRLTGVDLFGHMS